MSVHERLNEQLNKRNAENALRSLQLTSELVDFCSNDYLGFAQNEEIKHYLQEQLPQLRKLGATGSRLLQGNYTLIEHTERFIAGFHQAPEALFFNSGYEANSGLIASVVTRHDTIVYDELCHASLREGIRLSSATAFAFKHNDVEALQEKLSRAKGQKFIVIESVYSMDGDICPLTAIVNIAKQFDAAIILDEAHATGVIGPLGAGLAQHLNVHNDIFARVHTFGKAIGSNGAVVLGDNTLKQFLINFCKPFIYTTAPNYLQVLAVKKAYQLLSAGAVSKSKLFENIQYFKTITARFKHITILPSDSAIFSVIIPGNAEVKLAATYIQNAGYDVRAVLSPTVPEGKERLRICIHHFNTEAEILRLVKLLEQIVTIIQQDNL
jgi:8-amino-7-oxononanoate synthase